MPHVTMDLDECGGDCPEPHRTRYARQLYTASTWRTRQCLSHTVYDSTVLIRVITIIKVYCALWGCDAVYMCTYFSKEYTASIFRIAVEIETLVPTYRTTRCHTPQNYSMSINCGKLLCGQYGEGRPVNQKF